MIALLQRLARHGRLVLIAGLVVGVTAPGLAGILAPLIFPMIVCLLFLATLRVDPIAAFPDRRHLPRYLGIAVALQVGMPVLAIALLWAVGGLNSILGIGAVLVLAGAPLTGSPGLAILSGGDPSPALRQLVVGTAILPLTVFPVFWLMPVFGAPQAVALAALKLLAVIGFAAGAAMILRRAVPWLRGAQGQGTVDGVITLAMAVVVVGLMSAVGPAILSGDPGLWRALAVVHRAGQATAAPALAIVAGNRSLALFLGALPPETGAAMLLFIGCYQVPMYLTPMLIGPLARRAS
ncbi:hypothetical protein SAMN04487859_106134 [Roseovarius lutimaris]|uniref:Bile acid:Na+ symporter, BASS family n=1 Tax=Roseovarius lutimaris TaxID=1005928 RepID=A0A1I5AR46_9RHOB|nr:hypothetical protein [Roseovarius lutimaris]SFN64908.1 hypothetical protein SAMN04487859_106134 [Roseovarius lutimaris]